MRATAVGVTAISGPGGARARPPGLYRRRARLLGWSAVRAHGLVALIPIGIRDPGNDTTGSDA